MKSIAFLLVLCLLFAGTVIPTFAEAPVSVDYDAASDGDLLYTVNFNADDGVAEKRIDQIGTAPTVSADGTEVMLSEKAQGDSILSLKLKKYSIRGHVYTVDYDLDSSGPRGVVGLIYDGGVNGGAQQVSGIGQVANSDTKLQTYYGTTSSFNIDQKAIKRSRQSVRNGAATRDSFRLVIDGIQMTERIYVLSADGTYQLQAVYLINSESDKFEDYLVPTLANYDAISADGCVALSQMKIYRGLHEVSEVPFSESMRNLQTGDTLYAPDFTDSATYGWKGSNATVTASDTLELKSASGAAQYYHADPLLPYGEQFALEDHTMELFVNSNYADSQDQNGRVALAVLEVGYAVGFVIRPDTKAPNNMFFTERDAGKNNIFMQSNYATLTGNAPWQYRLKPTVYRQLSGFDLDTTDDTKPNVKIEFNASEHTVTLWELSAESRRFERISALAYGNGIIYYETFRAYAYNAKTNAVIKNVTVKKGLTANGFNGFDIELAGVQTMENPVGETTGVRFVSVIDSLAYANAGYECRLIWKNGNGQIMAGDKTVDLNTRTVFTAIIDFSGKTVTAEQMGGKYFVTLKIEDVPLGANVQVDFIVTPYVTDLETGVRHYGYTKTVSVINGKYVSNATALTLS